MSTCTIHIPFRAGDLVTERAARRNAAHRTERVATDVQASRDSEGSRAAGNSQILRRWSIAELIAAASWRREVA